MLTENNPRNYKRLCYILYSSLKKGVSPSANLCPGACGCVDFEQKVVAADIANHCQPRPRQITAHSVEYPFNFCSLAKSGHLYHFLITAFHIFQNRPHLPHKILWTITVTSCDRLLWQAKIWISAYRKRVHIIWETFLYLGSSSMSYLVSTFFSVSIISTIGSSRWMTISSTSLWFSPSAR